MITSKVRVTAQALPREAGQFGFFSTCHSSASDDLQLNFDICAVPIALRDCGAIILGSNGCS